MLTIVSQEVVTPNPNAPYSPPNPPDAEVFNRFYGGEANKSFTGTFRINGQELELSCDEFTVSIPLDTRHMRILDEAMRQPKAPEWSDPSGEDPEARIRRRLSEV